MAFPERPPADKCTARQAAGPAHPPSHPLSHLAHPSHLLYLRHLLYLSHLSYLVRRRRPSLLGCPSLRGCPSLGGAPVSAGAPAVPRALRAGGIAGTVTMTAEPECGFLCGGPWGAGRVMPVVPVVSVMRSAHQPEPPQCHIAVSRTTAMPHCGGCREGHRDQALRPGPGTPAGTRHSGPGYGNSGRAPGTPAGRSRALRPGPRDRLAVTVGQAPDIARAGGPLQAGGPPWAVRYPCGQLVERAAGVLGAEAGVGAVVVLEARRPLGP
jgi:hypothetical protein